MDELAKSIQKKYIEDITSKYPLHRFVCLFIFIVASYSISNSTNLSFLSNIGELKVTYVFNFKSGLLSTVNINNLAICLMLVFVLREFYTRFKDYAFKALSKTSDFDKYIADIETSIKPNKSSNDSLNYFLSKDVSKQLEKSRVIIRAFHHSSEIFLCIFISIIWGVNYWSYLEILASLLCVAFILWNQWKSFNYYISTFLPYYITEKLLLGGHGEFGDS